MITKLKNKKKYDSTKLFLFICFTCLSIQFQGQENNYWGVQQGSIAALTGGAVIANANNQTAAYYNPGLLPFVKSNSVSINASTYFFNNITIEKGAGENIDLEQIGVDIVPQNIFGILKLSESEKWTFSYAVLNQKYSNIKFTVREESELDLIASNPGLETYLAGYKYSNRSREDWFGFAAGYQINESLGIGLSTFGVINSINYEESRVANAIDVDEPNNIVKTIATSNLDEDLTYRSFGFLMKLGVSYKIKKLNLGLTVTSPLLNVNFIGKAWVTRSLLVVNDNSISDINQVSYQEKIRTTNKKPFTIDFGATYNFSKTEVSFRAAYYSAIDAYEMLDKSDFDNSSIFDQFGDFGIPKTAKKSVTNIGVGAIRKLSEKTSLYLGFNTDFNNFDQSKFKPTQDFVPSISDWDLYHFSAGLSQKFKSFQLIYGASFVHGSSSGDLQIINLSDPKEDNFLFGDLTKNANTSVNQINLHLGFVYYFL